MKTIIAIVISIVFSTCVNAQSNGDIISIWLTTGGGNGNYKTIIGTVSKNLTKAEGKPNQPFISKFLVSKKSFKLIQKFMLDNCNSVNNITERSYNFVIIDVINQNGKQKCYFENPTLYKQYFEKLITFINNSSYKNECKKLVADFKGILNSYKYDHRQ